MGRRYEERVDVQRDAAVASEGPTAFLWQQRLYQVREVLAHWHERAPWWEAEGDRRLSAASGEREVWRVAASAGRARGTGTYDLGCAGAGGSGEEWQLLEVVD